MRGVRPVMNDERARTVTEKQPRIQESENSLEKVGSELVRRSPVSGL